MMAVYTSVSFEELQDFIGQYSLGSLAEYTEIGDGIENTNYFVTLKSLASSPIPERWVLTIFENLSHDELPFFLELMTWLAQKGFAVPAPHRLNSGDLYSELKNKPAILVPRFAGRSLTETNAEHCRQVGEFVADMHLALKGCPQRRSPPRDLRWMRGVEQNLSPKLSSEEQSFLGRSIDYCQGLIPDMANCPSGIVHADLFKDNVLFDGDQISGVIDFFHACNDALLFDLAVIANDWTTSDDGSYDEQKLVALVNGYRSRREWNADEVKLWPSFLHLAALRFWLSRLESRHLPGYQQASTQGDQTKDPDELKRIIVKLGLV